MMNPVKKKSYKVEFETTNITLLELLKKYNITNEELGSTENWEKRVYKQNTYTPKHKKTIGVKQAEVTIELPQLPTTPQPEQSKELDSTDLLDDILVVKKEALKAASSFFEQFDGGNFEMGLVTTKEVKDMVGVLKDLESGELARIGKTDKGPTINVLIQNLTKKFSDDC